MNLKKALKKGLAGITEDDFVNAMKLIATSDNNTETDTSDKLLREKYPFYQQLMKMSVIAVKDGDARQIAHFSGMISAYKLLLLIAEDKI